MNIFLDTSSLFKLYFREADSATLEVVLIGHPTPMQIFIAPIARIEFASALCRKVRTGKIDQATAVQVIQVFDQDAHLFEMVPADDALLGQAKRLIGQYGASGLRTLDAIQLAAAISLRGKVSLFLTSDQLLHQFFTDEQLPV